MQRTKQNKKVWKRYKEVSVPWDIYDAYRVSECQRVLDLQDVLCDLDRPIQRREFKLSCLTILLLFKILFGIGYRGIASATKDLKIYQMLGMKRAPCYKTIQNTMHYLDTRFLSAINQILLPKKTKLGGVDSSGMKTHQKGAWVIVRFQQYQRKQDFKKVHIFVDLISKKIIYCLVTKVTASDSKQLKKILRQCDWMKVEIILGDTGYDTREYFTEVKKFGAEPGITVRKNASTKSRGCSTRGRAVRAQQRDFDEWSKKVHYTMRCISKQFSPGQKRDSVSIFSVLKQDFAE